MTRYTAHGDVAGDGDLRASRTAALLGVTRTPARLLGRSDIGHLQPGARADLVLLDADPVTADVDTLAHTAVTETWVSGVPTHAPIPASA
jgi:predicted amidohydrolase YtcJ